MPDKDCKHIYQNKSPKKRLRLHTKQKAACLTVAAMLCTLASPALTAATPENSPICGMEEHAHSAQCFNPSATETELSPLCGLKEHTHTEECWIEAATTTALLSLAQAQNADARADDIATISGNGIQFGLFNYSLDINKTADAASWREISKYFTFRNSSLSTETTPSTEIHIPNPNINTVHDADGFTAAHATVERTLDANGSPVLDLTRNADGTARTDPGLRAQIRSLAYLFSDVGDHAVTAYTPANTILQKDGTHYWYKSSDNAVDYDTETNLFRVRSYAERNSTTAGYGADYGDFLPFNYTGGTVIGTNADNQTDYHLESADVDYWFGMTMEVNFFQARDGMINNEEMVFCFSGDDDVWVFVDDVLVLDLGGTHGTVDGSINFSTGEIRQYLSWKGANASEAAQKTSGTTSFPTTLKACFDAAGVEPNGGWDESGETFADYTKHTLHFFYLERGAAVANCSLDFTLPTLPDKSLTVTKDLTADDAGLAEHLDNSLAYRFRVMKADSSGNATDELFLPPGTTYTLLEDGAATGTGTVGEDGIFALTAGQSAQFTDMLAKGGTTKYIVQEILPDDLTGQYAGVEYTVSGAGGETKAENGLLIGFTAFATGTLSAEQTQTVTFHNKVDTAKLSELHITKQQAEGASFDPDQLFRIQVELGDLPLPAGTVYTVGKETKTVTNTGIIELRIDETAVLDGILSGTGYTVTELKTAEDGFNASYSGTVTAESTAEAITSTANGASGQFPLNSTVHIIVTNANYDFAAEIPLRKQAVDNDRKATFTLTIEQVENESGIVIHSLPGASLTVNDDTAVDGKAVIGYPAGTEGTFTYIIREQQNSSDYIFDETFYRVEITAADGKATITGLWKNGTEVLAATDHLTFINRRTTSLMVTKTVIGDTANIRFPFTATVTLNGKPFLLPQPNQDAAYTVEGNVVSFTLGHNDSLEILHIPYGAAITVTETAHNGFSPSYRVEDAHTDPVDGNSALIEMKNTMQTVHFINTPGIILPKTGGRGTMLYTTGGLLLSAAGIVLLYNHIKRRKEDNAFSRR